MTLNLKNLKMADDLDFVVKFPPPTSTGDDYIEIVDRDNWLGTDKEPVVVLLGWLGCQDRYLNKYSEIHTKKGCITIGYIPPTEDFYFRQKHIKTSAAKLLELILDLNLEENPIFFHVFSNGGGYVYRNIMELLFEDSQYFMLRNSLKGCIFDSCPSPGSIIRAASVLSSPYKQNIILYTFLYVAAIIYLCMVRFWQKITGILLSGKNTKLSGISSYYDAMKNDPSRCPQLFLYSKCDKLVSYTYIEHVIKYRRALGIHMMSTSWDDSEHVAHFRTHKGTYIQRCYDFIDSCLNM